jgi:hypothetical protein
LHPCGVKPVGAADIGHGTIQHHIACLAAAEVKHHLRGQFQPRQGKGRVHAAFEPVTRVRGDLQRAPGRGDGDRVPVGGFKEHIGGGLGAARMLAPHDARKAFGRFVIGNQHHAGGKGVAFAVKRQQLLAALGGGNVQAALHLGRIEHMQRAVQVIGEEVGDIDQRRDRAQANGQ